MILILIVSAGFLVFYIYGISRFVFGINNLKRNRNKHLFTVTLIVSIRNEEQNLPDLADCLLKQEYPRDKLQIILINDRSTDHSAEFIDNLAAKNNHVTAIHIHDIHENFAPKKRAIDRAVKQAAGEILLFTDADGRPGSNWISAMVENFDENTGMVLGYAPYFHSDNYKGLRNDLLALEYFSHAAVALATTGLNYPVTCVGTNLAYRKKVYEQLDGFGKFKSIHTGDDDLFLQRVREETEWEVAYATSPDSFVYNIPPETWRKFYNQRIRYGSKGFLYPKRISATLVAFYLFNLFILFLAGLALKFPPAIAVFAGMFFMKALFDYHFLSNAARKLSHQKLLDRYWIAAILHVPYILYFGLMAQIQKFEWSGLKQ